MSKFNVVFICDNNYVMPTVVAMMSLANNVNSNDKFTIFVICDDVSLENKTHLMSVGKDNLEVKLIDVDSSKYNGLEKKYSSVSKAALLKFDIPNLINEDKVLYIDGDVLIVDNISDVFNVDIENVYAAVVQDGPKGSIDGGKEHAFYAEKTYFNSGVMYLNLKRMKENNISEKLLKYRLTQYNYFMDQDAFNKIFGTEVVYLSVFYDFMLHLISYRNEKYSIQQLSDFYDINLCTTIDDLFDHVKIYHYTFDKPWKYYDIPMNEIWINYYKKSPFKGVKLYRESIMTKLYHSKTYETGKIISKVYHMFVK